MKDAWHAYTKLVGLFGVDVLPPNAQNTDLNDTSPIFYFYGYPPVLLTHLLHVMENWKSKNVIIF